jgi:pilus assembly protein CpaC
MKPRLNTASRRLAAPFLTALAALHAASVLAQTQTPAPSEAPPEPRVLTVPLGRSQLVEAPWLVKRLSVTNPEIADVQALAPQRVLVQGKTMGSTDLFLWNEAEEVWQARVDVVADLDQLKSVLSKSLPGSTLELSQSGDVVIVGGALARAEHAEQLNAILEDSGLKSVDTTHVAGVHQVQIEVRIAEVSRTAIRALTVNGFQVGDDFFGGSVIGPDNGGPLVPVGIGPAAETPAVLPVPFQFLNDVTATSAVTLFGGWNKNSLEVFVQALAENQYLRILAEPSLVALSGEEARFLAGGEFPIPVVQGGAGTGTNASITIEYKEFGVSLAFLPVVLGDGSIRLNVAPEVSQLSAVGSVMIQGFSIPSVLTRRASTTVELKSGQTFAMAGLLTSVSDARNSRVPVLGDLPIIGTLFRSVRYERGETELVVLVTASLVEPLNLAKAPPLPGTIAESPSDWEIFLGGKIDDAAPEAAEEALAISGTGLERLKGPGAWTSHDAPPVQPRPEE